MKKYNPELSDWRGKSYKKGGENINKLKDSDLQQFLMEGVASE